MKTYAILYHPGHNRVYFDTALALSASEFTIAAGRLSVECKSLQNRMICGIYYLTFEAASELSAEDIGIISELSFVYAIFAIEGTEAAPILYPILRTNESYVDESISTIMRYMGKTNELFTKMMVNIAVYSQPSSGKLNLLDPIAGKGTTLFEGLVRGFNVYGVEVGEKVTTEAYHFLKRFLENAKYKFDFNSIKVSGPNKSYSAQRHTFEIARTKGELKEKNTRIAEFIAGNSQYADGYYKKNYFNMIVGDLPYGIQHGNVTNENQSSLTRNPTQLLRACLPAWKKVLHPEGVIVLSWNNNVLTRERIIKIFEDNGFSVENEGAYTQFEHRVDQAIVRDIIVARKQA